MFSKIGDWTCDTKKSHGRTGRGGRFNGQEIELKSTFCSGKTYILLVKLYTLKVADKDCDGY